MKHLTIIFLTTLLIFSCSSSSEDDKKSGTQPKMPSSETLEVKIPSKAPVQAQSYGSLSNLGASLVSGYSNLSNGSMINGTYTWSLTHNGFSLTVTAQEKNNGEYSWEFRLNGTDPESKTVYENWLFMSGSADSEGKSGTWIMYNFENKSTTPLLTITWATNKSNTITTSVTSESSNDLPSYTYTTVENVDGSGSIIVKEGNTVIYTCIWNADGSGSWEDKKNQTSGTF